MKWLTLALLFAIGASACGPARVPEPFTAHPTGQVSEAKDEFGVFYAYVPVTRPTDPEIVVLVHGTPAKAETAEATARFYLESWVAFAEAHGCLLIAPAFTQEDFSSREGDHALGGYRGLFGRRLGADAWVLRLVQAHQRLSGAAGKPFYLYGHSAGGQFVGRFLVTHPEAVRRAVITAAATYPQPRADVAWPFGLGELQADIEWDKDTRRHIAILPDEQRWLAATQVPLAVIVGGNDTSEVPAYPGQQGKNRLAIARNWVEAMASFSLEHGFESRFEFMLIPGIAHSMIGLMPFSQAALIPK